MEIGATQQIATLSSRMLEAARDGDIGDLRKLIDLPGTLVFPFISSICNLPGSEQFDEASRGLGELYDLAKKGDAGTEALTAICATLASIEELDVLSTDEGSVQDILNQCAVSLTQVQQMSGIDSDAKANLVDLVPRLSSFVLVADAREVVMVLVPHFDFEQVVWIQDVPPSFPFWPTSETVSMTASEQVGEAVNLLGACQ